MTSHISEEKQTLIVHFYPSLPGFEDIGDAVIKTTSGSVNFVETVRRIAKLLPQYLYETPLYGFELLNKHFEADCVVKLENMQRFADSSARQFVSIVIGNYLTQQSTIQKSISEVEGIVLVLDAAQPHADTIAMISMVSMKKKVTLVVPKQTPLTLWQVYQLSVCKAAGVEFVFHDGDTSSANSFAQKQSVERKRIFINPRFSVQYAILGAATMALSVLEQRPDLHTIVIPARLYELGCIFVTGFSFLAKIMKPSVKVVLTRLEEQIGVDDQGNEYELQGLFPDWTELGFKSRIIPEADPFNVFDSLDAKNTGVVTKQDIVEFLNRLSSDTQNIEVAMAKDTYHYSAFSSILNREYLRAWQNFLQIVPRLQKFSALDHLKTKNFIDSVVTVTEDEAAFAFLQLLLYTHTLANGKGILPFAALWAQKVPVKGDKVAAIISGGFVDVTHFQYILEYAMGLGGSNFTINSEIPDNSTSLSRLLDILGISGVSVHDVTFDRTGRSKKYHVQVSIQCLCKTFQQQGAAEEKLKAEGYKFQIISPHDIVKGLPVATSELTPRNTTSSTSPPPEVAPTPSRIIKNIQDVTPDTIRSAYDRVRNSVHYTPLYRDNFYSKLCGCEVYLKFDNIQKTGSFKARGSTNMVLKVIEESATRPLGLVAASAGNHAQGVALVASKVGLPCTIICPEFAPETKLSWTRQYGAEVLKVGSNLEEALEYADKLCKERKWLFVKPFNDVDIIEGQGTLGYEIHQVIPNVDTVLVNVGGGGMIAGISLYLKGINPKIRIVGIQSEVVAPLVDYKTSHVLNYIAPGKTTIADGVAVRAPGGVHNKILQELVDEYVTVTENEIASTIVNLLSSSRTLSEGAGCLGLAALMSKKIKVRPDEKVCIVICGGNIDMTTLKQIYEYGLRSLGRFFTVNITTNDGPGNLSKIIQVASQAGLKVHEIHHNRGIGNINWNEVTITISFYSNSFKHQNQFLKAIIQQGKYPEILGRDFIKDHEVVYEAFDQAVKLKKQESETSQQIKKEQFVAQQLGLNSTKL